MVVYPGRGGRAPTATLDRGGQASTARLQVVNHDTVQCVPIGTVDKMFDLVDVLGLKLPMKSERFDPVKPMTLQSTNHENLTACA